MFINQSQVTVRAVVPSNKGRIQERKLVGEDSVPLGDFRCRRVSQQQSMKIHRSGYKPFSASPHLTQSTNEALFINCQAWQTSG